MRIERNLNLIAIFTLGSGAMFLIPVLLPFYRDEIGIGYREFLLGECGFSAAIVLCDVPTGWISDVWRRKHTLALGVVVNIIGWLTLLFAHSFWQAFLAQAILGIGYALLSGTHTALLYDSLLSAGRDDDYRKKEGKRLALSLYAIAAASVAGGFLYSVNHAWPIYATLAACVVALISTAMMDEPERHQHRGKKHPLADMIGTMKYALHGHAEVGFLIVFTAVMFCATKLIMWSQQPYYLALNFPSSAFGVLMAVGYGLGGASSHFAHRFDGRIDTFHALIAAWALALIICLGAAASIGLHGVALLMFGGSCIYGTTAPRVNEAINRLVGSERRATILSTQSFLTSLLFIPISSVTGWASNLGGIRLALGIVAVWLCLAGACLAAWRYRTRHAR